MTEEELIGRLAARPGAGSTDQVEALIDHAYGWARRHDKPSE
jgi:hypothetical protein